MRPEFNAEGDYKLNLCLPEKSILPFKALPRMEFSAVCDCGDSEDMAQKRNIRPDIVPKRKIFNFSVIP